LIELLRPEVRITLPVLLGTATVCAPLRRLNLARGCHGTTASPTTLSSAMTIARRVTRELTRRNARVESC
jgi:hypothetical protein